MHKAMTKVLTGGAAVAVAAAFGIGAAGGTGATVIGGSDDATDTDPPIAEDARAQAEAAALEHTQGGRVTSTEDEAEENQYEIEVTNAAGASVEVELDRDFKVVEAEADDINDVETNDDD